jgi:hypothetical protein
MQILFNAQDHSYNGKKITYTSVSKLIGKYKRPYNRDYWSKYKAYEKLLGQKEFKAIRKELGHPLEDDALFDDLSIMVSQEALNEAIHEVLSEWKSKNDKSIIKGNNYHEFKENQAKELGYCENPFTGKKCTTIHSTKIEIKKGIEYRSPIVTNLYDLEDGFHPELILWNDKVKIAGQADLVFIETKGDKRYVQISDFKTNGKIDTYNFMKHRMLDPLSHLMDCNYNHYRLQISCYAWLLEQAGFIPTDLEFRHITTPYQFKYMKKEVESIMPDTYDF